MMKTLIAISLFLASVVLVDGQDRNQSEAKMVRGPFAGGDALHVIQEVALDLKARVADAGDRVAVRVCSKEKLPVALLTATASPFVLREHLEHYGIAAQRILLLRSEDCVARDASLVLTEFWIVPKGAEPPASVESIQSDRVRVELVRRGDTIKTAKDYSAALHDLLERVSVRPEAVAVVVGSYYKRPSAVMANNLEKARRTLLFGSGQASRVYIHSAPAGVVGERQPRYPDLFVFNAEPDAAQVPASCEAAAANLDFAVIETKKVPNTYLIIVARLGKNEPETLNRIRLAAAEEYVLRRGSEFKYVVAAGAPTSGLGRLELYVNGRLYSVLPYEKNATTHCIRGWEGW